MAKEDTLLNHSREAKWVSNNKQQRIAISEKRRRECLIEKRWRNDNEIELVSENCHGKSFKQTTTNKLFH